MRQMTWTNVRARRSGFTLIELLVVLMILALLGVIVVPKLTGRTQDSKIKAARTQISNFETAIEIFEKDNERYPSNDEGLRALVEPPGNMPNWKQLLKHVPADPWGNPYVYRFPGQHNAAGFDIYSTGPDGRESDDDITNWSGH